MCMINSRIFLAGFNVETVEYKNISFTVWDVGGQDKVSDYPLLSAVYYALLCTYI